MGTTNEMGETNLASKIREWAVESEALCVLIRTTARKTERDALGISNKVSELVHQVTKTNYTLENREHRKPKGYINCKEQSESTVSFFIWGYKYETELKYYDVNHVPIPDGVCELGEQTNKGRSAPVEAGGGTRTRQQAEANGMHLRQASRLAHQTA